MRFIGLERMLTPPPQPANVLVQVFTPSLAVQLGWVKVEGLWQEQEAVVPAAWRARRTARARWGPVVHAQRQIWRDKGL